MKEINLDLSNLNDVFPDDFTEEQIAHAKTLFSEKLSRNNTQILWWKNPDCTKSRNLWF